MGNIQAVYMAVSPDKYELPLVVEDSGSELARKIGCTTGHIYHALSRGYKPRDIGCKRGLGYRIYKVEIELDEED